MASQILHRLESKPCLACGEEKTLDAFHLSSAGRLGRQSICKACRKIKAAAARAADPAPFRKAEAKHDLARKHRPERKAALAKSAAKWRLGNSEKVAKRNAAWKQNNKHKVIAHLAKRKASKIKATPGWLSAIQLSEIEDFYEAARAFRLYTGAEYHVDHIVPLISKSVCGLHVPWNLQVLPAKQNLSKNNSFPE
jgi:hypothetical protein